MGGQRIACLTGEKYGWGNLTLYICACMSGTGEQEIKWQTMSRNECNLHVCVFFGIPALVSISFVGVLPPAFIQGRPQIWAWHLLSILVSVGIRKKGIRLATVHSRMQFPTPQSFTLSSNSQTTSSVKWCPSWTPSKK